jgi:glycosyltransferase involved in cell wall biosynthesis
MKHIAVIDTGKEWGGGTNSLLELLKRIDKIKYRFTVLFYYNYKKGDDSDIKREIEKLGINFILLSQKKQTIIAKLLKEMGRVMFFFSKKIKKYIIFFIDYQFRIKPNAEKIAQNLTDLKADLLYMNNNPSSNLEGIIASKITGIPALQHCRTNPKLNFFEIKISNSSLRKIICVSEGVKNTIVTQGIDNKKCIVVYNGIDSKIKPSIQPNEIRKKWKIFDEEILIGTVGSLLKRKKLDDFIEAISILYNKTNHPIKCMVIGSGPEKEKLEELAMKKNLKDKVIFTGFQNYPVSYINAMDIFVLTSEQEGLPRVILEAMLMGKPVVASNVSGPSELVVDGETGFLVPAKNPQAFANGILKLIKNPTLRTQMGEKARKRVIENFSIEKYVAGVESVFNEVLRN